MNPVMAGSAADEALARELQRREMEAYNDEVRAGGRPVFILKDPVWGELVRGERVPSRTVAVAQCCPCFLGAQCSPERRGAWARVLRTASLWLLVLYAALLLFSLTVNGFAPFAINPMLGPFPDTLSAMGAKNLLLLQRGQLYRLVSPAVLHAGLLHLLFNGLIQFRFGIMLEVEWGTRTWLGVFVLSALLSSVASCVALPGRIGVGASGALMGLIGAHFVDLLYSLRRGDAEEQRQRRRTLAHLALNIAIVLAFSFVPLVDWAAHAGGLLGGVIVALAMFADKVASERARGRLRWAAATAYGALFLTLLSLALAVDHAPEELGDLCQLFKDNYPDHRCL